MRSTLLAAAMLSAMASSAIAQSDDGLPGPLPDRRAPAAVARRGPPLRLFISPAGEPFRGGEDGLAAWMSRADADHDGSVSVAEFRADADRAFALYDANHDGRIDGFEISAYETEIVPEITRLGVDEQALGGGRGRGGGRRGGVGRAGPAGAPARGVQRDGAAQFSLLNEPEPLAGADEDLDGRVSKLEWAHATNRRFAKLDQGAKGSLTLESLRAPPKDGKKK